MTAQTPSQVQSSVLPPAQPSYILRGHTAQIHSVHFLRQNLRLLTGDADGWVVLWDVPIKRPVAVWKAHAGTVLGLGNWGEEEEEEKVITHGRDGHLHVWQIRAEDEANFSTVLPIEDSSTETERPAPWLLHSLAVNTLNFCSFAMCPSHTPDSEILIATPGLQDGMVNITALPSEARVATIPPPRDLQTGMLMAVALDHINGEPLVLAGYETGHVALWQQNQSKHWSCTYLHKSHTQPVLSVALSPSLGYGFSSSADAVIARHPLAGRGEETKILQTRHAGQQSLALRSDAQIFATAGWDGRVRVYSTKTLKELAVLKWHKEGVYAVGFAKVLDREDEGSDEVKGGGGGEEVKKRVRDRRREKEMRTHWLAAGSKDGKVSLWEVY